MTYTVFVFCMGAFVTVLVGAGFLITILEFRKMGIEYQERREQRASNRTAEAPKSTTQSTELAS